MLRGEAREGVLKGLRERVERGDKRGGGGVVRQGVVR